MSLVGYDSSDEETLVSVKPSICESKINNSLEKLGLKLPPPKHSAPKAKQVLNPFKQAKRTFSKREDEEDIVIDPLGGLEKNEEKDEVEQAHEPEQGSIPEFNVSEYYQENKRLKAEGLLEETKHYKQVYDTKNQLRSLIKNAEENKDVLDDLNKDKAANKKQRKDRYGW